MIANPARGKIRFPAWLQSYWTVLLILVIVVAAALLFVITRGSDPRIGIEYDLTNGEGGTEEVILGQSAREFPALSLREVIRTQTRTGVRPIDAEPDIDFFLASPTFFSASGNPIPHFATEKPTLLFYVSEDAHDPLNSEPPSPVLRINGGPAIQPAVVQVLADSSHHRTTIIGYQDLPVGSEGPIPDGAILELSIEETGTQPLLLDWQLPAQYPNGFETDVVLVDETTILDRGSGASFATEPLSWAAMLAIMAGMLTALSPCLIQLAVYFSATLSAVSAENGVASATQINVARRHILMTAMFFSVGFTIVYTAGGAAAGYVGQSLDQLGLLDTWMRPFAIGAGILIIILAFRVAWNARAPLVCKMPMTPMFGSSRRTGVFGSALMGISFAGGCLACFSASILPALLLYAGATGSMAYGATLLFLFSLGISVPCMMLALGVSRFTPVLKVLGRHGPALGLVSAVVMVAFGVIMISDQFHVVSGVIGEILNI